VDFTGVEKEIGKKAGKRIPEGDYVLKIGKVERKKNKAGDAYYFSWRLQVVTDARGKTKHAGTPFYYTTSLKPEALFNLRNMIFACTNGKKNVAGKAVNFDPSEYFGTKIGATIEDDEYDGKIRSQVSDVMPLKDLEVEEDEDADDDDQEEDDLEDVEDDDEEEEVPVKKAKKKKKAKKTTEEDDDDL
jgi:hypothetical protein